MTIAVALVAMVFLPNYPATTKWLTEEEKTIAQARLLKDMGAEDATEEEDTSLMRGLSAAVKARDAKPDSSNVMARSNVGSKPGLSPRHSPCSNIKYQPITPC